VDQVFLETPLWVRLLGTPHFRAAWVRFSSLHFVFSVFSVQTKAFAGFTGYFQKTGWTIFRRSLAGGVPKRYRNHGAQRLFPLPEKKRFNQQDV